VRPLSTSEKAAKARHRVFVQRPGSVQMRALRFGGSTAGQDEYVFEADRVYVMAGKEHAAQLFQEMVAPAITGSFLHRVNTLVRAPTIDGLLLPCAIVPSNWAFAMLASVCCQVLRALLFCVASFAQRAPRCISTQWTLFTAEHSVRLVAKQWMRCASAGHGVWGGRDGQDERAGHAARVRGRRVLDGGAGHVEGAGSRAGALSHRRRGAVTGL